MNANLQKLFFDAVHNERQRQERLWGNDQSPDGDSGRVFREKFVAILGEEFGEVCKALLEGDEQHAVKEMVEVAAVCCRYFELPPRGAK